MAGLLDFSRRVITGFSMWVQLHGPACRQGAYIMALPLRREAGGLAAIITTHIPEGRDAGLWTIVLYISQLNTLLKDTVLPSVDCSFLCFIWAHLLETVL